MTKSATSALIGMLVADGQLAVSQPVPGLGSEISGPRRSVTVDMLLRQTSGLPAQTGSGFDLNSRMLFSERDTAEFAATEPMVAPPGTRWGYTDGNYAILSGLIRKRSGGTPQASAAFYRDRLFAPLGMRNALIELDPSGTPMGATHMIATARDWGRLGLLMAHDGVIAGRRLLPEGWIDYAATPTPSATFGYGAGLWTNRGDSEGARRRRMNGAPADSFFASGNFGQVVLISPGNDLVIVRLALSHDRMGRDGIASVNQLAATVLARGALPKR